MFILLGYENRLWLIIKVMIFYYYIELNRKKDIIDIL